MNLYTYTKIEFVSILLNSNSFEIILVSLDKNS
jgi:hypothetical protein